MQQTALESSPKESPGRDDDDDYRRLRDILAHDPISIDELRDQSGLTIDQLSSMLLILELQGEVEALSGGRYTLIA